MRFALDAVTFIIGVRFPERLSSKALRIVQSSKDVQEPSLLSLTEMAIKNTTGSLRFTRQDALQGVADLQLRLLPFSSDHALHVFDLPLHHRDPFDRQIIALALAEGLPGVTCDEQFRFYNGLKVIW